MDRLETYRTMHCIRRFEERVEGLFRVGKIPGLVYLYIGQEAEADGVLRELLAEVGKAYPVGAVLGYCEEVAG